MNYIKNIIFMLLIIFILLKLHLFLDKEKETKSFIPIINQFNNNSKVITIDLSHYEIIDDPSITIGSGLGSFSKICLYNGYTVFKQLDLNDFTKNNSKMLLLNSPLKKFNQREIENIKIFMMNGAKVVFCVNAKQKDNTDLFLKNFGLSVSDKIIGPALVNYNLDSNIYCEYSKENEDLLFNEKGINDSTVIKFYNANSLLISDTTNMKVICKYKNSVLVVEKKYGSGSLLVISDELFLSSQNLLEESYINYKVYKGNIKFVKDFIL